LLPTLTIATEPPMPTAPTAALPAKVSSWITSVACTPTSLPTLTLAPLPM
jgi:hypothetical protein